MFRRPQSAAVFLVCLICAVTLACDGRGSSSVSPSSPSSVSDSSASNASPPSVSSASPMTAGAKNAGVGQVIKLFDACDPQTFNAALGPDTCSRSGGVRFDMFLELLGRHHSIGAWHFTPPQGTLSVGQALVAKNQGGETHTFTEVDEFGGGIVPLLNSLTGLNAVAPECNQLAPKDFIPPGGSSSEIEDESGVEKYQCCIHPWMRAEIRVVER